jgi:hypothetical protein
MQGIFGKTGEMVTAIYRSWGIGVFALPVLVAIALVGLVLIHPDTSGWMPESVKAELTGASYGPKAAPKQVAPPATAIRTVKAN